MAYGDNLKTYTGDGAYMYFSGQADSDFAIGDFSLTLDRGTVEQELVGETGNWFTQGAVSIEGSLTSVKLGNDGAGIFLEAMINNNDIDISGATQKTSGLAFHFPSCAVTGFDISLGDASTITEGSIDFTVLNPYDLDKSTDAVGRTKLTC